MKHVNVCDCPCPCAIPVERAGAVCQWCEGGKRCEKLEVLQKAAFADAQKANRHRHTGLRFGTFQDYRAYCRSLGIQPQTLRELRVNRPDITFELSSRPAKKGSRS